MYPPSMTLPRGRTHDLMSLSSKLIGIWPYYWVIVPNTDMQGKKGSPSWRHSGMIVLANSILCKVNTLSFISSHKLCRYWTTWYSTSLTKDYIYVHTSNNISLLVLVWRYVEAGYDLRYTSHEKIGILSTYYYCTPKVVVWCTSFGCLDIVTARNKCT